jgi:hypothetical protein
MKRCQLLAICLSLLSPLLAYGHSGSVSYVHIENADHPAVSISLDLLDLEYVIGIDTNGDAAITWGELSSQDSSIARYVTERLTFSRGDTACVLTLNDLQVEQINDGEYAVMRGQARCADKGAMSLRSNLLFDVDVAHRSLVEWRSGDATSLAVLTSAARVSDQPSLGRSQVAEFAMFAAQGMWHIWTGFDHLAFVLILLLPASRRTVASVFDWRRLIGIVSAFTLAHSLTLALAVSGVVVPPERPIEIAIAASVSVAALTNMVPRAHAIGAATAFTFGLLHGFGFASALQGLGATQGSFSAALVAFNLGVEAGQLFVVAAVLPLLFMLRKTPLYATRIVPGISLIVAVIGSAWVWERAIS